MSQQGVKRVRRYDNSARAEQAKATRHRVLEAAYRVLTTQGYAAATIKAIAAEAGVSAETIYKTFETKAKLVKDVYDVTLVGDEDPIPLIDRPEYQSLIADPSARGKLTRYAAISRTLSSRLGPLLDVLLSGAKAGKPELQDFAETIKKERMFGATEIIRQVMATGQARPDLDPDRARDAVWTLNSPEVYQLLSRDRGWSDDAYEDWLARSYIRELLD